jgi:muconolactone delta-isomerase
VEALQGLSPAAAEQLAATCTLAITRCYADAVEPLPWNPTWLSAPDSSPAAAAAKAAAEEAAMKVELNRVAILEDIIRKSGLARPNADAYGATYQSFNGYKPKISPALVEAVDDSLKRLCLLLLSGQTGPKPEMREAAAVSTAAMAFFRNRASSPRDMTAAAAEQFRAACDHLLKDIY